MVAEPTTTTYSDAQLTTMLEAYPSMDITGTEWYHLNYLTVPPSQAANTTWLPTYDLNAAASDIWAEKAAVPAQDYDLAVDGGNFSRSQVYEQAMKQARYYASKRNPSSIRLRPMPRPYPNEWDTELP